MKKPPKIQLLPEHIIDQIKAGEVVEKPASLLKEIIENSIDAKSNHLEIEIKENGLELISLKDDGLGMNFDDLPFAFCRHATSKIEKFDDIYRVHSYGFRGEALASISSVSRVTCLSSPSNDLENGGKFVINGGEQIEHSSFKGQKSGTSLIIRDLFYNTPARKNFIKSKTSEKNSINRIIYSFILSNPQISFKVRWDEADKMIFPKAISDDQKVQRIKKILCKNKDEIIFSTSEYEKIKIELYFSKSSTKGNAGKNHFLFANSRLFGDRQIHQTILRSLAPFWEDGQTGHYTLFITLPSHQMDPNVHPSKTHIKFLKLNTILSLISSMAKENLPVQQSISDPPKEDYLNEKEKSDQGFTFDVPSSFFQNSSPTSNEQLSSAIFFDQYAKISTEENKNYLIKFKSSFLYFLKSMIENNPDISEANITPLLIGHPVKVEDKNLEKEVLFLKTIGVEFDKIGDDTLLLKTIPSYLDLFPTSFLAPFFLEFAKTKDKLQDIEKFIPDLSERQIKYIIDKASIEKLEKNKFIVQISKDRVERMFT